VRSSITSELGNRLIEGVDALLRGPRDILGRSSALLIKRLLLPIGGIDALLERINVTKGRYTRKNRGLSRFILMLLPIIPIRNY
jgi:hypothetical protein